VYWADKIIFVLKKMLSYAVISVSVGTELQQPQQNGSAEHPSDGKDELLCVETMIMMGWKQKKGMVVEWRLQAISALAAV